MKKTIICVAPIKHQNSVKGNRLTPEKISEEVYKCYLAGASIVHLHVPRDKDNDENGVKEFINTINLIKEKCNIFINISASDFDKLKNYIAKNGTNQLQFAAIDSGSFTLFDFAKKITRKEVEEKVNIYIKNGLYPEMCAFDLGMLHIAKNIMSSLGDEFPHVYGMYLGYPGGVPADLKIIEYIGELIGENGNWFYAEYNRRDYFNIAQAIIFGGHIRVGLEDNLYQEKGSEIGDNETFVRRVANISTSIGREIANTTDVRRMLEIK